MTTECPPFVQSNVKTLYIDVYTVVSSFRVELGTLHTSVFQYMYKVTKLKINCTLKLSTIPFSTSIIKEIRAVCNLNTKPHSIHWQTQKSAFYQAQQSEINTFPVDFPLTGRPAERI